MSRRTAAESGHVRFTDATRLSPAPGGAFSGETSPVYWNMIGPFGGWIAAVLLRGVLAHPEASGEPISASISFAAAVRPGAFEIRPAVIRANRSTAFWRADLVQTHDGEDVSCAQASVVLAKRRESPTFRPATAPEVPDAGSLTPWKGGGIAPAFLAAYDVRFVRGGFRESAPPDSALCLVRDAEPGEPLDFPALVALCDIGLPPIFYHARRPVPISTLVMNAFFHASSGELTSLAGRPLIHQSRMRLASNGYFDVTSEIWSPDGPLLATTEQIVWFKIPAA